MGGKKESKKKEEAREKAKKEAMEKLEESSVNRVETDIDKLMQMINEKESVNIEEISKKLKVDIKQIEEWGKILEDRGLIEIVYPLVGRPVLRRKEWEEKKES